MDKTKFWNTLLSFEGGIPVEEPYQCFYITEGLVFLRDKGNCQWLIDAIYHNLPRVPQEKRDIVTCDLSVVDRMGTLVMRHTYKLLDAWTLTMKFEDIDLIINEIPLYCQPVENDWVLMTPHESLTMLVHKWTDDEKPSPEPRKPKKRRTSRPSSH